MSTSGASSPSHKGMISYNWGSQQRMILLKDKLIEAGISVWMDVDKMAGNMNDRMAEGVEGTEVILLCFSKKYQESDNCKLEAEYAKKIKKRIIPLKYEDYIPTGWLGLLISSLIYYDVSSDEALMENFDAILNDIKGLAPAASNSEGGSISNVSASTNSDSVDKITDKELRDVTTNASLRRDHLTNLFVVLDIDETDVENGERIADTRDYKVQAFTVLKSWRTKKRKHASKKAIIEALEECGYLEAVEILKDIWGLV